MGAVPGWSVLDRVSRKQPASRKHRPGFRNVVSRTNRLRTCPGRVGSWLRNRGSLRHRRHQRWVGCSPAPGLVSPGSPRVVACSREMRVHPRGPAPSSFGVSEPAAGRAGRRALLCPCVRMKRCGPMTADNTVRCKWAQTPLSAAYHDLEWGVPVHDDRVLFEFLTLEGAQAGLSWETILKKRDAYRKAFANFDPAAVAKFRASQVERLLANPGIVRNRLKVLSTVSNAKAFLKVQQEFGSF